MHDASLSPTAIDRLKQFGTFLSSTPLVLVAYVIATTFTSAYYMADTIWYAHAIHDRTLFEDSGHLLWRTAGWLAWTLHKYSRDSASAVPAMIALNSAAGFMAAYCTYKWLASIYGKSWGVSLATIGLLLSNGFLNYTQSGTAYAIGLSFFMLGLYILATMTDRGFSAGVTAIMSGAAFSLAVCLWLPYIFAIPGAAVSFLSSRKHIRASLLYLVYMPVVCAVAVVTAYYLVATHNGINETRSLSAWLSASSHGISMGGFARMLVGFPRSLINIGQDGLLFKRFWVHDPYNPVSLVDLMRYSTFTVVLFYVTLAAVVLRLIALRTAWNTLFVFFVSALPVFTFAIYWQGGDVERYMPMYPALFLLLAASLTDVRVGAALKCLICVLIAVEVTSNVGAMSNAALVRKQDAIITQLHDVIQTLDRSSIVVTLDNGDEVWRFTHDFPLNTLNVRYGEFAYSLCQNRNWRGQLAATVLATWDHGGDVWLSRQLLDGRPRRESDWIDGENPCVTWSDIPSFLWKLDLSKATDRDEFLLIKRSPTNERYFRDALSA